MKKSNILIIIPVLFIFPLILTACTKKQDSGSKDAENTLNEAQKTMKELEGNEENISFSKTIKLNEEVTVTYRLRDYKDIPENVESLEETQKYLKSMTGQASFKVTDLRMQDKLGENNANNGKSFYIALYEFKGSTEVPDSPTIHPSMTNQTGWDPAPQIVLISKGKDYYSSSYSNELKKELGITEYKWGRTELNQENWTETGSVWNKDTDKNTVFAIKYYDENGDARFIKIEK